MKRTYKIISNTNRTLFEKLVAEALEDQNTVLVGGVTYDSNCLMQAILITEIEPLVKD